MDNTTTSYNYCKSSLNNTETDFINCYICHTHIYYKCPKDNNSLSFK